MTQTERARLRAEALTLDTDGLRRAHAEAVTSFCYAAEPEAREYAREVAHEIADVWRLVDQGSGRLQ